MWRFVAPAFEDSYRVMLADLVGAGKADLSAYDKNKYASLDGHVEDLLEICKELALSDAIFVGHSVSAMIGVLASIRAPQYFSRLVLVSPSPCYINDDSYTGGFEKSDIESLLDFLDNNYLGWSQAMAPVIMGNSDRPQLGEELTNSFCRTDPTIAKQFARTTFLSDHRQDLRKVQTPSLILQCSDDRIAPDEVGKYVHQQISNSRFIKMRATGHCPNLSAPEETIEVLWEFLKHA